MNNEFRWLVKGKRPGDETRTHYSPDLHDHESKKLQYRTVDYVTGFGSTATEWVDIPVMYEDDPDGDKEANDFDADKAATTKQEKNLFSYHYSAMYTVPNGTAYHDGILTTNRKIKTHEEHEELKKDISPDNAHKMTITSLSFLGMVKEDGMTEEIDR